MPPTDPRSDLERFLANKDKGKALVVGEDSPSAAQIPADKQSIKTIAQLYDLLTKQVATDPSNLTIYWLKDAALYSPPPDHTGASAYLLSIECAVIESISLPATPTDIGNKIDKWGENL